ARHRAGASHPCARHHHRDRRAHHGSHYDFGAARAGVQQRPHDRAGRAGRRGARWRGDRGLSWTSPSAPSAGRAAMIDAGSLQIESLDVEHLQVEHLHVRYGDLVGVADVSLKVPQGSVVALLGSNGAGKTTTLNAIAGLVAPSGGSITWRGEAIARLPAHAIVSRGLA